MKSNRKTALPILLLFVFLNTLFLIFGNFFEKQNIDRYVIMSANVVLFISNFIAILLLQRSLKNANPNVFVRSMMAGTVIKLLIIAVTFVAYAFTVKKNINKPAVYISIFLYFLYLAVEVAIVLKLNKQKNA